MRYYNVIKKNKAKQSEQGGNSVMKKKVVAVLLAGAMAGTMLTGCGGDSKAADSGDTKKEDTADKAEDSEDSGAEGKVTLNVTTTFAGTESNVDKYQESIEKWQKETGNKVNDSSASADEAMKARVITDFETGAEPDVLFYSTAMIPILLLRQAKWFPLMRSVKNIRTMQPI